jgi:hypothetical protein
MEADRSDPICLSANDVDGESDDSSDEAESIDSNDGECIEREPDESAPLTDHIAMSDLPNAPDMENMPDEQGGARNNATAVEAESPSHRNSLPSDLNSLLPSRYPGEGLTPIACNGECAESNSSFESPAKSPIFVKPVPVRASINRPSAVSGEPQMSLQPWPQDTGTAFHVRKRNEADWAVRDAVNNQFTTEDKSSKPMRSQEKHKVASEIQDARDNTHDHIAPHGCSNADGIDEVDGTDTDHICKVPGQEEKHVLLSKLPTPDATIELLRGTRHDFGQSIRNVANRSQDTRVYANGRAPTSGQTLECLLGRLERIECSLKARNQPSHGNTWPRLDSSTANGRARLWSQVDVCPGGNEEAVVIRVPSSCAWNVPALVSQTAALANSLGDTMNEWKGWSGKRNAIGNLKQSAIVPPRVSNLPSGTDHGEFENQTVGTSDGKPGDSAKKRRRI